MHILVTGAFGFVGLNVVRWLASQPKVTVAAADLRTPDATSLALLAPVTAQVRALTLDVTDRGAVQAVIAAEQPTHILHAAALTPSPEQERANPTAIVDVNLTSLTHVLEAARVVPSVKKLLVVSSSGVYGAPRPGVSGLQGEEGPLALDGLYGITKYSAELLGAAYAQLGDQMIAAVRLSAIYGPREVPSASRPRISQVGALFQALQEGRRVKVAGPDVLRDWTHTEDIAAALWALLGAERWNYPVYNVSYGAGVSFQAVVDCFVAHGLAVEWVDDLADADIAMPADHARLPLDIRRLQADTDHVPRLDISAGVARLVG